MAVKQYHFERSRIHTDRDGFIPLEVSSVVANLTLHEPIPITEHTLRLCAHFDLNKILIRCEEGYFFEESRP